MPPVQVDPTLGNEAAHWWANTRQFDRSGKPAGKAVCATIGERSGRTKSERKLPSRAINPHRRINPCGKPALYPFYLQARQSLFSRYRTACNRGFPAGAVSKSPPLGCRMPSTGVWPLGISSSTSTWPGGTSPPRPPRSRTARCSPRQIVCAAHLCV